MPATTTRLINRIWGEFYSNYSPEDPKETDTLALKEVEIDEEQEEDGEEDCEDVEEEKGLVVEQNVKSCSASKQRKSSCSNEEIKWVGKQVGRTCEGEPLYKEAVVCGSVVSVGGSVLIETGDSEENPPIYVVEYMFENSNARKMVHGRLMLRGFQTVLGNTANEREVFLTNNCLEFELDDVIQTVVVETRSRPWGHQYRKADAANDKIDRERAEDRKRRGLPMEYFCKSVYCPDKGGFFCLQIDSIGLGTGLCQSCKINQAKSEKEVFKLNSSMTGFTYDGTEYCIHDFAYLGPHHFGEDEDSSTFKGGRNVGLKPYVICQLLEIEGVKALKKADPQSIKVKVKRFFRPEDVSAEKAYRSDIQEVFIFNNLQFSFPLWNACYLLI